MVVQKLTGQLNSVSMYGSMELGFITIFNSEGDIVTVLVQLMFWIGFWKTFATLLQLLQLYYIVHFDDYLKLTVENASLKRLYQANMSCASLLHSSFIRNVLKFHTNIYPALFVSLKHSRLHQSDIYQYSSIASAVWQP